MKKVLKKLLIVLIILFLILVYARYVGTMGLDTKEYAITSTNLPDNFDGIKIVHFSDLHYNRAINKSKVKSIIDEINLINPDIVVFTGDLIDKDATLTDNDYNDLTNLLMKITARYGKYAIMGNHDYIKDKEKVVTVYNESNFNYLDNDYDIIYGKDNQKMFIGGINTVSYGQDDIAKTLNYLNEADDIGYRIVLVHEPDISSKIVKDYSVNLILAGHSHNGQVRLPIIGPIYTPPHAKKYYDNYYDINGTSLYVSSGIGVSMVNYRLWNHPSINFYRLNKEVSEWDFLFFYSTVTDLAKFLGLSISHLLYLATW